MKQHSPEELAYLRRGVELQFRKQFYKDPKFPFLPSLGITHILHGFDTGEVSLGLLHMWWEPHRSGITFAKNWESEWLDNALEAVALAKIIEPKSYDLVKLVDAHKNEIARMDAAREIKKIREMKLREEEEKSKHFLWN